MQKSNYRIILLFVLMIIIACTRNPKKHIICTEEARAGLNVLVLESGTNNYLSDSVTVIVASGSGTFGLEYYSGNPPIFAGAYEQPGTYTITASKPGYKPTAHGPIHVTKDDCHVIPQTVSVTLWK